MDTPPGDGGAALDYRRADDACTYYMYIYILEFTLSFCVRAGQVILGCYLGVRPRRAPTAARSIGDPVRIRTCHRVPPTPRMMYRSSRRRRPVRKHGTQVIRWVLLKTRNPTRPEETSSGCAAAMGCPRSIRSPLEPRGSLPFNTKNKRKTREKE
jgi:hypothetical protein